MSDEERSLLNKRWNYLHGVWTLEEFELAVERTLRFYATPPAQRRKYVS